jgi:UDP-N-acetylmuramyl tripeptide synthase
MVGQPLVVIDMRTTSDAPEKCCYSGRGTGPGGSRGVFFYCGGDRDTSKRSLMAAAAEKIC